MSLKTFTKSLLTPLLMRLPLGLLLAIKQDKIITRRMDYPRDILMRVDTYGELSRVASAKKEPGTVRWIEEMSAGEVLYDIGANTGPYSLIAAANDLRVVAVEPHPMSFAKLCYNVVLNNMGNRITPLPVALAEKTGLSPFNYTALTEASSGHALGVPLDSRGKAFLPIGSHDLLAYRLDDLVAAFKLPAPNHIKIDVDGIEPKVLTGAQETLKGSALKTVLVELEKGDAQAREAIELFAKLGFRLREVREGRNHLFVRK